MSKKIASPNADPGADPERQLPFDSVEHFEGALKELEEIVAAMERDDLPLEQSLRLFERGTELSRICRGSLASAELRVKNLLEADPTEPEA